MQMHHARFLGLCNLRFDSNGERHMKSRFVQATSGSLIAIAVLAVGANHAQADKLPKSAKPLSADQVKALYADHTVIQKSGDVMYFAPDGTVKGTYPAGYFTGTWTVKDNEACMMSSGTDSKTKVSDGKVYTDCWKWFKDAKGKHWTMWSVRFDGSKPGKKDDFYSSEYGKLKAGDHASGKFKAMGGGA